MHYAIYFEHVSSVTTWPDEDFGYLSHGTEHPTEAFESYQEAWRFLMTYISENSDPWDWKSLDIKVERLEKESALLRVTTKDDENDEMLYLIEEVPD